MRSAQLYTFEAKLAFVGNKHCGYLYIIVISFAR